MLLLHAAENFLTLLQTAKTSKGTFDGYFRNHTTASVAQNNNATLNNRIKYSKISTRNKKGQFPGYFPPSCSAYIT